MAITKKIKGFEQKYFTCTSSRSGCINVPNLKEIGEIDVSLNP